MPTDGHCRPYLEARARGDERQVIAASPIERVDEAWDGFIGAGLRWLL